MNLLNHAIILMLLFLTSIDVSEAKVFITLKEALDLAFPSKDHWTLQAETLYLTPEQLKKSKELSGVELPSALVVRYRAKNTATGKQEFAYTDTHKVRTHTETMLILIGSDEKIRRIEVLSFEEPLEYMPKDQWYDQFKQSSLDADLQVKKRIPFVTGASLTAQASVQAARRSLSVHQVLGVIKKAP